MRKVKKQLDLIDQKPPVVKLIKYLYQDCYDSFSFSFVGDDSRMFKAIRSNDNGRNKKYHETNDVPRKRVGKSSLQKQQLTHKLAAGENIINATSTARSHPNYRCNIFLAIDIEHIDGI